MSIPHHTAAHHEEENYLTHDTSIQSWLLTRDHKRIALLYFLSVTLFFTIGGLFASLVRIELLTPAGDFMSSEMYNQAFTSHGVMMIFFPDSRNFDSCCVLEVPDPVTAPMTAPTWAKCLMFS